MEKMIHLLMCAAILAIFLQCSTNTLTIESENDELWLIQVSPGLDQKLTSRDTIQVTVGYNYKPMQMIDTVFYFSMVFKDNNNSYVEVPSGEKSAKGFSGTVDFKCPVEEIIRENPKLNPLQFSFSLVARIPCTETDRLCFIMFEPSYFFTYKNGVNIQ